MSLFFDVLKFEGSSKVGGVVPVLYDQSTNYFKDDAIIL